MAQALLKPTEASMAPDSATSAAAVVSPDGDAPVAVGDAAAGAQEPTCEAAGAQEPSSGPPREGKSPLVPTNADLPSGGPEPPASAAELQAISARPASTPLPAAPEPAETSVRPPGPRRGAAAASRPPRGQTSRFRGVCWDKGKSKWLAQIWPGGRKM